MELGSWASTHGCVQWRESPSGLGWRRSASVGVCPGVMGLRVQFRHITVTESRGRGSRCAECRRVRSAASPSSSALQVSQVSEWARTARVCACNAAAPLVRCRRPHAHSRAPPAAATRSRARIPRAPHSPAPTALRDAEPWPQPTALSEQSYVDNLTNHERITK